LGRPAFKNGRSARKSNGFLFSRQRVASSRARFRLAHERGIMQVNYPEVGICGLSCRLCPRHHTKSKSRCGGCKSKFRMDAGCPFITCAVKKKGIEFCWQCSESQTCDRWAKRREWGKDHDSFTCYQALEDNMAFIRRYGIAKFRTAQRARERLLVEMLDRFNEGRSKTYYCLAATVLNTTELRTVLVKARKQSAGLDKEDRSRLLHSLLDKISRQRRIRLKLRK